jgi:hypothetical protein
MHTLEQLRSGQLAGAREIKIACGLSEFPCEIFALADTLEVLDLSGNAFSALPDDFARLHKLRIFFASNNRFTEVPEVLGQCPALSMVGFKANLIRHLSGQALPAQLRRGLPDSSSPGGSSAHVSKQPCCCGGWSGCHAGAAAARARSGAAAC